MTTRRRMIYEGKAKILYEGPEPGTIILEILDNRAGLRPFIKDLGLAFINHAAAGGHCRIPSALKSAKPRMLRSGERGCRGNVMAIREKGISGQASMLAVLRQSVARPVVRPNALW